MLVVIKNNFGLRIFVAILCIIIGLYPVRTIRAQTLAPSSLLFGVISPSSSLFTNDSDSDGLVDSDEVSVYHTDPTIPDTDGDGYADGEEIRNGYSPLQVTGRLNSVDSDDDGLSDELELKLTTDLAKKDTDNDGVSDRDEVYSGRNPLKFSLATSTVQRSVKVDLDQQQLTYFFNGIKLGTMPVSTGQPKTPTPPGSFKVLRKVPVVHYVGPGYDLPNTKWNLEFKRSFYVHGAYWHTQFGIRTMSHGCVNMAYRDVEKLYAFLQVGDTIEIVGKTPRGKILNPITFSTTEEIKKADQHMADQLRNGS